MRPSRGRLTPACVVTADLDPATRRGHSLCPRLEAARLPARHVRAASTGPGAVQA
jgi:acetyl esterase/lipase